MSLRTLKYWAIYDPERGVIVDGATTKTDAEVFRNRQYEGCVLVRMRGHYVKRKTPTRP